MLRREELRKYKTIIISKSSKLHDFSRLYYVEAIGIGMPLTESLNSYLTRLAQEHCVSTKKLTRYS